MQGQLDRPITIACGDNSLYNSALCICGMPEPCIFTELEAIHVDLGARRVGVTMGKITARKTWRNESIVRRSSICVQVAYDYHLEACHQTSSHAHIGDGSGSTLRHGRDGRLVVGKSESRGYHRQINQRLKGPHDNKSNLYPNPNGLQPPPRTPASSADPHIGRQPECRNRHF